MGALEDRRQSAREAYYDCVSLPESHEPAALEEAIEVATRVRITDEVIGAFCTRSGNFERGLRVAFEAAGFEVVE